jgi:hypothetical protein
MEWHNALEKEPELGEELLFYKDGYHVGYISLKTGSRPRKWVWYSYGTGENIEDVYFWHEVPDPPNEDK